MVLSILTTYESTSAAIAAELANLFRGVFRDLKIRDDTDLVFFHSSDEKGPRIQDVFRGTISIIIIQTRAMLEPRLLWAAGMATALETPIHVVSYDTENGAGMPWLSKWHYNGLLVEEVRRLVMNISQYPHLVAWHDFRERLDSGLSRYESLVPTIASSLKTYHVSYDKRIYLSLGRRECRELQESGIIPNSARIRKGSNFLGILGYDVEETSWEGLVTFWRTYVDVESSSNEWLAALGEKLQTALEHRDFSPFLPPFSLRSRHYLPSIAAQDFVADHTTFKISFLDYLSRPLSSQVTVWIEAEEFPLRVDVPCTVHVKIGHAPEILLFTAPDWGHRETLELILTLSGDGITTQPCTQSGTLPRYGDMPAVMFTMTPSRVGTLEPCLSIFLERELILLEELTIEVEGVLPAVV